MPTRRKQWLRKFKLSQSGARWRSTQAPVGPALGQHGVNIMEFCRPMSDSEHGNGADSGCITVTRATPYHQTPPASFLLKKAAGVKSGSHFKKGQGLVPSSKKCNAENARSDCADMMQRCALLLVAPAAGIEVEGVYKLSKAKSNPRKSGSR